MFDPVCIGIPFHLFPIFSRVVISGGHRVEFKRYEGFSQPLDVSCDLMDTLEKWQVVAMRTPAEKFSKKIC